MKVKMIESVGCTRRGSTIVVDDAVGENYVLRGLASEIKEAAPKRNKRVTKKKVKTKKAGK